MSDFLPASWAAVWPWVLIVLDAVVVLLASAHVVLTKRDSRAALGWVGVIWLTPLIGTVLYVTFGINRIQRKARLLRGGKVLSDSALGRQPLAEEVLQRVLGDDALHLAPLVKYVSRLTHQPLADGNHITPLTTGRQAYDEMLSAIDAAQRSVGLT